MDLAPNRYQLKIQIRYLRLIGRHFVGHCADRPGQRDTNLIQTLGGHRRIPCKKVYSSRYRMQYQLENRRDILDEM